MYRLKVTTKSGIKRKHYYDKYDDLEYNSVLCKFSPNIQQALGQELTMFGWKTLFEINNEQTV